MIQGKFFNIPNMFSLSRVILMIPAIWLLFHTDEYSRWFIFSVFFIAGITDYLDGWSARKFNQVSDWGKILDPLADKICLIASAIALVVLGWIPLWYMIIVFARDILIMLGGIYFQKKMDYIPMSLMSGKIAVNFIAGAFLCRLLDWEIPYEIFFWASLVMMIWSFAEYVVRMLKELKKVTN